MTRGTQHGAWVGQRERRRSLPPSDVDALCAWARRELCVHITYSDRLRTGTGGAYQRLCHPDLPEIAGIVLLRPGAGHPRWVIAHELGHHLLGHAVGYWRLADGAYLANMPGEREANACAAALLLDIGQITERFLADWTCSQIATAEGVPVEAIGLRIQIARLLGEHESCVLDTAHADLCRAWS